MLAEFLAESTVILLVQGQIGPGREGYAYLAVPAVDLHAFMQRAQSGELSLDEAGVILVMGEGTPDEDTREFMRQHYHFNHEASVKLCPGGEETA